MPAGGSARCPVTAVIEASPLARTARCRLARPKENLAPRPGSRQIPGSICTGITDSQGGQSMGMSSAVLAGVFGLVIAVPTYSLSASWLLAGILYITGGYICFAAALVMAVYRARPQIGDDPDWNDLREETSRLRELRRLKLIRDPAAEPHAAMAFGAAPLAPPGPWG